MALRIIADENMPNVEAWFSDIATRIVRKPGRTLSSADLATANVLLVRSVTQVNQQLLQGSDIQWVGSATIGTDHIDQNYLAEHNIPFHYAPGCNAQSVVDWLLSVFARLHIDHDLNWWDKTIGIVGVGHVGGKVAERLKQLGCRLLLCDPPKHEAGLLPEHQPLASVLANSDVVCFHTPHTQTGEHATDQMIGEAELHTMKAGSWLINAGRGPVIQAEPLLASAQSKHINVVLDVWPTEPQVPAELLQFCHLASPHVAGYSLEGKHTGTKMLFEALSQWAKVTSETEVCLPNAPVVQASLFQQDDLKRWASELVLAVYDPARDTVTMNASLTGDNITRDTFDALRKQYPTRRELNSTQIQGAPEALIPWLTALGFSLA